MRFMRRFGSKAAVVLALMMCLSCLFIVVGCGEKSETAELKGEVTVEDQIGRTVEIPSEVKRIVTNYGIATQMVYALGAEDRLVGIDTPTKQRNADFFKQLDNNFDDLPAVGMPGEMNIEEVVKLEPDVVLVRATAGTDGEDIVGQLENAGLAVLAMDVEDLDKLNEAVEMLSKALGVEDKADEYLNYYEETRENVDGKLADLADSEKPSAIVIMPQEGAYMVASDTMYQSHVLELCGGQNAAAGVSGMWAETSPEQITAWDPDYIFIVHYGDGSPEEFSADPKMGALTAVKDGKVIWFPSNIAPWDYPSMQAVLGITWCAKTFHPDKFEDVDVKEEADEYFEKFFGKSFTDLGGEL
ncbi:MAG: ABC transporter substrate-binding protein [Actinobacteria bacterium]|nr:ABC transporter substrate-binding protein [Actinomycetota bacterium]